MFADPVTLTPPGQDQRAIHIKQTLNPPTLAQPLGVLYTVGHTQYSWSLSPRQMTENASHFMYFTCTFKSPSRQDIITPFHG